MNAVIAALPNRLPISPNLSPQFGQRRLFLPQLRARPIAADARSGPLQKLTPATDTAVHGNQVSRFRLILPKTLGFSVPPMARLGGEPFLPAPSCFNVYARKRTMGWCVLGASLA